MNEKKFKKLKTKTNIANSFELPQTQRNRMANTFWGSASSFMPPSPPGWPIMPHGCHNVFLIFPFELSFG